MKKKCVALLLTAALTAGMTIPAMAAGETGPKTTTVKTTVAVDYEVVIPAEISITFNTADTPFNIEVTKAILDPKGKITVTTTAAGEMKNASDENSKLAYTMKDDQDSDFNKIEFTTVESKTCKVHIEQTAWDEATAGNYSGTTTFTVAYDDGTI